MKGFNLPTRTLVDQNDAAIMEAPNVPRSRFQNHWTRKTTFDAGYLVPILVDEILPGDHMRYEVTAYLRMSTLLYPMFDNQRIDTFFFFIPNRLVWDNWAKFMGEQTDPGDSIAFTVPKMDSDVAGYAVGSIFDHMGLPTVGMIPGQSVEHITLPLRGYNLVYNEWFRDENIQDSLTVRKTNTGDVPGDFAMQFRGKAHDYFTSALPWPQKFDAPTIPIGTTAPVLGIGSGNKTNPNIAQSVWETGGGNPTYAYGKALWDGATNDTKVYLEMDGATGAPLIFADLSAATGVAINQLRQAWMIQGLYERDARGGTRYVELIRSHFGVTNPDFRLQRPEYIGGGSSPLNLTPIAQTAPTTGVPLGALGAAGTAAGSHSASYAATEHGFILGLINVRTELSYGQGYARHWFPKTRVEYPWPSLMGLGEQPIYRKELYVTGVDVDDDTIFGYQERYHEYRTKYSEITGKMRSTATGTLDAWHLAQKFLTPPVLDHTFIIDNPPVARVVAAGVSAAGQQYLADIQYRRVAVRPISMYGTPVALGRF